MRQRRGSIAAALQFKWFNALRAFKGSKVSLPLAPSPFGEGRGGALNLKHDRYGDHGATGLPVVDAGFPAGHHPDDAHGLGIEQAVG